MKTNNDQAYSLVDTVNLSFKYEVALLIDDNYIDNFISEQMLTSCNFSKKMHFAINGQVALDILQKLITGSKSEEQLCPDIIFVDLNMPVMNGIEFLREFHQIEYNPLKKCKIVVLTSSIHDVDKALVQKIDNTIVFMNKPLSVQMLNSL